MATSYKTLYLNLQAEHIELMSLTRRLMTRQLDDMKEKEDEAKDNATQLQSTMAAMASAVATKINEDKKHKAKTSGTGTANK